jgi:hypothetical protein
VHPSSIPACLDAAKAWFEGKLHARARAKPQVLQKLVTPRADFFSARCSFPPFFGAAVPVWRLLKRAALPFQRDGRVRFVWGLVEGSGLCKRPSGSAHCAR